MFRIAWIDDDIPVLKSMLEPLEQEPDVYAITYLSGFAEARAEWDKVLEADLVLIDILGPVGPGIEPSRRPGLGFLKELRDKHYKGKVICFSILDKREVTKHVIAGIENISAYVKKPILPGDLKRKIDDVLLEPRTQTDSPT